MLEDNNQKLYADRRIVQHYTQLKLLQPAEQTILNLLHDQLATMKMLDIGVGGGRTTQHFSQFVLEYVGIDYSPNMIAACQKRFTASSPKITFEVCDARDMSRFQNDSFDLIAFSFNGIDYISHCDRLKIFQEVRRVGKSGGYFFFSSHNLQGMEREFDWGNQFSLNPIKTYTNLVMFALLRLFNYPMTLAQLNHSAHVIVKDEAHNFRLQTYYIRPEAQIDQLKANFDLIKVYSWVNGLEITSAQDLSTNADMWLYYLCGLK